MNWDPSYIKITVETLGDDGKITTFHKLMPTSSDDVRMSVRQELTEDDLPSTMRRMIPTGRWYLTMIVDDVMLMPIDANGQEALYTVEDKAVNDGRAESPE